MTLVLTSPTLVAGDPAFAAVIAKTAAAARQAGGPVIGGIVTPAENPQLAYPAAHTALIQIGLTEGIDQVLAHTKPIIDAAKAQSTPQVDVGATGGPAIFTDFNSVNTHDLAHLGDAAGPADPAGAGAVLRVRCGPRASRWW